MREQMLAHLRPSHPRVAHLAGKYLLLPSAATFLNASLRLRRLPFPLPLSITPRLNLTVFERILVLRKRTNEEKRRRRRKEKRKIDGLLDGYEIFSR